MNDFVARIDLPFYMRLPEGLELEFVVAGQVPGRLRASRVQQQDGIGPPGMRARGARVSGALMWWPSTRSAEEQWATTSIHLRLEGVPDGWVEGLPARGDVGGVRPRARAPLALLMAHDIVNKLILSYRWASAEQWNLELVRPLTVSEVTNRMSVEYGGDNQLRLRYITGFNTNPLPPDQQDSVAQLMRSPGFPETWQVLILEAGTACARGDVGIALVLADSGAEVFIDQWCLKLLAPRYEIRQDGAYYNGTPIRQTHKKYLEPVRDAAGKSLSDHDHALYSDLLYLHRARNNFAHSGGTWYQAPNGRIQVDVPEAQRLVNAARRSIEATDGLLR